MTRIPSKIAAAFAVAFAAGLAAPVLADDLGYRNLDSSPQVYFDLGIVVSTPPTTAASAKKYVNSLPTEGRDVLIAACDDYLTHTVYVAMAGTIPFCYALLESSE